ncbi:MAG: cellulase family glycosylhydrolase [Candidatus Zipacnadales bacterium]
MNINLSLATSALLVTCMAYAEWQPSTPLTRQGSQLLYEGKPFAAVGVNKHELLDQYMAELLGKSPQEAQAAREAAKASLAKLQNLGVEILRVRVSGFWPAQIEATYLNDDPAVVKRFWACLDAMLDDCDVAGIRVIPTIAWHLGGWADLGHESLRELFCDPDSQSRRLLHQWTRDLVARYKDRDTILFWELTNEANLGADLRPMFAEEGVLRPKLDKPAPHLVRGPVIRDGRNNYSSDELAALTREWCRLIKSIDPRHLIGTGFSAPRPAAWHLWLGSLRRADQMDWTVDTSEQQADYLRLITPEGVDLVSLHTYGAEFERILDLKLAADSLGIPVYVGEIGISPEGFQKPVYDDPNATQGLALALQAMREIGVPLTLPWTWDEWGTPVHEPVLRPEAQPEVVKVLREANEMAHGSAGKPLADTETLRERMQQLSEALKALLPPQG